MEKEKTKGLIVQLIISVVCWYCLMIPIRWLMVRYEASAIFFVGESVVKVLGVLLIALYFRKKRNKTIVHIESAGRKAFWIALAGVLILGALYIGNIPQTMYGVMSYACGIYGENINLFLAVGWEQLLGQKLLLMLFLCILTVFAERKITAEE